MTRNDAAAPRGTEIPAASRERGGTEDPATSREPAWLVRGARLLAGWPAVEEEAIIDID
jgi:hypothetical protein